MAGYSAGSASVQIVPDFSGAQQRINAWFAGLGPQQVQINPTLNNARLRALMAQINGQSATVNVHADTSSATRQVGRLLDTLTGFSSVMGPIQAVFGPRGVLMASGVGALTMLAAAATQVAPALLMIPAAAMAAAGPLAALTIGMQGVKEAFSALSKADEGSGAAATANAASRDAAAKKIQSASRGVESAQKALEQSHRGVTQAERGVVEAHKGLEQAERGVVQAHQAVADAERNLEHAHQAVADAEHNLVQAHQAVTDAERGVVDAHQRVADAERNVEMALRAVDDAERGVIDAHDALAAASRGVETAERNLEQAQISTRNAQAGLNDARAEATRQLVDMNTELARSSLDEESAILAVQRAQENLTKAMGGTVNATLLQATAAKQLARAQDEMAKVNADPASTELQRAAALLDVEKAQSKVNAATAKQGDAQTLAQKEADLAYRKAQANLEDIQTRNTRLAEATAKANEKGVEGSDLVVNAKDKIVSATQAEQDAAQSLVDAHKRETDAQQAIVDAEQKVADAHYNVAAAQRGVAEANDGVAEAQRRVEEANYGVQQAERGVADAVEGVAAAQRGLADAQYGVVEANDKVADAQQGIADANQALVDAQANVVEQQRDLADAQKELADATTEATTSAGKAADAAAAAMAKLAPSARDFVEQMRALKPAWDDLKKAVQENLFKGLGDSITTLAKAQLPTLKEGLAGIATELNTGFRASMAVFSEPKAVNDFATVLGNVRDMWHEIARAAEPFTRAFIDITTVGSQYLPAIGKWIGDIAEQFGAWVGSARESGKLQQMMETAFHTLGQIWEIGKNVFSILTSIFAAAMPGGNILLGLLGTLTKDLAVFAKAGEGHSALASFFDSIAHVAQILAPALETVIKALVTGVLPVMGKLAETVAPVLAAILTQVADAISQLAPLFYPAMAAAIGSLLSAISPLIPILTEMGMVLFPIIAEVVQTLAPVFAEVAEAVGEGLLAAVQALAPILPPIAAAIAAVFHAIAPLLPTIVTMAVYIGGLVLVLMGLWKAWGLINAGIKLVTTAWRLLSLAFALSPIGVVIVGLVALGAGLVALYQHSETFRKIVQAVFHAVAEAGKWMWENVLKPVWEAIKVAWDATMDGIKWAWEHLLKPAWDAVSTAAQWLWNNALKPAFTGIKAAWDGLVTGIQWAWENILKPVWDVIQAVAKVLLIVLGTVIFGPIALAWKAMTVGFQWAWDNVLKPVWDAITTAAHWLWENVLKPIFGFIKAEWDLILSAMQWTWEHILKPVWDAVSAAAKWLWETILKPIFGFIADAWKVLSDAFQWAWDHVLGPVFDTFGKAIDAIKKGFDTAVEGIKKVWDTIQDIVATPINFIIAYVLNKGLFVAWNWIVDTLGLPAGWHANDFKQIEGHGIHFASGGQVPGYSPNDRADNIPAMLTAGEFVQPVRAVDRYGPEFMEAIRTGMFPVELARGFADGGMVTDAPKTEGGWFDKLMGGITQPVRDLLNRFTNNKFVQMISGAPAHLAKGMWDKIVAKVKEFITNINSDTWGITDNTSLTQIQDATKKAAASFGWSSDVSWAALKNLVMSESGWNPNAKNPTSTASGLFQQLDGTWAQYRTNMAAKYAHARDAPPGDQISAGLAYIQAAYGSPEAAWSKWLSRSPHWYAEGGLIGSLRNIPQATYDSGGWLPPGITTVFNGTGRPEPVLTASEHDALLRYLATDQGKAAADAGRRQVMGDVHIYAQEDRATEIMDELWHRMRVAGRGGVYSSTATVFSGS